MMTSSEIRQAYLDFFKSKDHIIVPSAPVVIKNDPTLLFTNAGMNQFKDYFLGNVQPIAKRIADTQKCLRVSGKHNDLEEVGVDTYHHTLFEMLGNWSFGDYFKAEAIAWSWELLTEVYKLDKDRLYVTVFEGDEKEGLPSANIALQEWNKLISNKNHILFGNKKDNFWEMGDIGPCGPCSEIHYDARSDAERALVPGEHLVNKDHPQVIEIWNNVFIQFNRKKDGSLEELPAKHVDTGMGFERLVRVIQGKNSNYDTDVFSGTIANIENIVGKKYQAGEDKESISFRVLADHIRAISFTIADGQLPSNTGAGYVIRRILRRGARYYFTYLNYKKPLLHQLVPIIAAQFANVFPELAAQKDFVAKVIKEEEETFLRTLEKGLKNIEEVIAQTKDTKIINGRAAFDLLDTYGFPIDLTRLIASENGLEIDDAGFEAAMQQQKDRSRAATNLETEDWVQITPDQENAFIGYNNLTNTTEIIKFRKVNNKGKVLYQIVLKETPFYAESGGQIGDTGTLTLANGVINVIDTKKENNLILHICEQVLEKMEGDVATAVDAKRRKEITLHHSVTHLMQAALRNILGTHVTQKGSLNSAQYLRFDFSHFAKVTAEEIKAVETLVNEKIRENHPVVIKEMHKDEAVALGAMALFGEKYGDMVRVVTMDKTFSVELCGGTHVANTGEIGLFKITSEAAVAAGVRRIEAVCGSAAEQVMYSTEQQLNQLKEVLKTPKEVIKAVQSLQAENVAFKKHIEMLEARMLVGIRNELLQKDEIINGVNFVGAIIEVPHAEALKTLAVDLKSKLNDYVAVLVANINGKPSVALAISDTVVAAKSLDATKIIKEHIAPLISGGGGGQKGLATAGGQNIGNLPQIITVVKGLL
jgi:alanyl-tRNA synthetase